jgi:DNA-directed RNA polymerase subunit RPC12/RpoP
MVKKAMNIFHGVSALMSKANKNMDLTLKCKSCRVKYSITTAVEDAEDAGAKDIRCPSCNEKVGSLSG